MKSLRIQAEMKGLSFTCNVKKWRFWKSALLQMKIKHSGGGELILRINESELRYNRSVIFRYCSKIVYELNTDRTWHRMSRKQFVYTWEIDSGLVTGTMTFKLKTVSCACRSNTYWFTCWANYVKVDRSIHLNHGLEVANSYT